MNCHSTWVYHKRKYIFIKSIVVVINCLDFDIKYRVKNLKQWRVVREFCFGF